MQIAKNQNGVKIPASRLEKRKHDLVGERYYCIHCGVEVIPRIGERGLSHYAKHNEMLHKSGCPEIYLNTSVKLPSSNSKKINFKEAKDAILKNLNYFDFDDLIFKVEMQELLVTKNNQPVYNNKQTYVVLTEVIDDKMTLDCGLNIKSDVIDLKLEKGTKFLILTPITENTINVKNPHNIYNYNDMDDDYKDYFDNIVAKQK